MKPWHVAAMFLVMWFGGDAVRWWHDHRTTPMRVFVVCPAGADPDITVEDGDGRRSL